MKIYKITEASDYLGVSINTLKEEGIMGIRNLIRRIRGKESLSLHGVQCPACRNNKTYYVSGNSAVYSVWHCVNCNRDFEVRYGSRYRTEI